MTYTVESIPMADAEVASTGSVSGAQSEIQSCGSSVEASEGQNGYSSEGETTMYSAETAESRNYMSPLGGIQQIGRSQSSLLKKADVNIKTMLEKQGSFTQSLFARGSFSKE